MIKSKRSILCLSVTIVLSLLLTVSCGGDGKVRKYKEKGEAAKVENKAPHGKMNVPAPDPAKTAEARKTHFKWEKPEGWTQESAASSFRLATFTVKSGEQASSCTIIPLQGTAGGLKANVSRWLGQVSGKAGHADPMLAEGDASMVQKLLAAQKKFLTKGQFPAVFIDFTTVTPEASGQSILATVITVSGSTVFIKMTGSKSLLLENKKKFMELCQSFNMANPPETAPAAAPAK